MLRKEKILICLAICTGILFFTCRKPFSENFSKSEEINELKSWLSTNGQSFSTGQLQLVNKDGNKKKASLNWANTRHFKSGQTEYFEVPFVFAGDTDPIFRIDMVFQKSPDNSIVALLKKDVKSDPQKTEEYKTKKYYSADIFDNLAGKKKAAFFYKTVTTHLPTQVYEVKGLTVSTQSVNSSAVEKPKANFVREDECDLIITPNYEYECDFTGYSESGGYNEECGYSLVSYTQYKLCNSMGGGDGDPQGPPPFDFQTYYVGYRGPQTIPEQLAAFDNQIKDSLSHPCIDSILAQIKRLKDGKIADIIQKFSNEIPHWNWTLKEGTLSGANVNGNTSNRSDNDDILTILDYAKLSSATNLAIARTIIHESIHAYLVVYFRYDNAAASLEYPLMVKEWAKRTNPSLNAVQHDQMEASFVSSIAEALKAFGEARGLIIDDYVYNDMAWGGLNFNDNSTLSDDDKIRIQNRLSAEQNNRTFESETPAGTKACN